MAKTVYRKGGMGQPDVPADGGPGRSAEHAEKRGAAGEGTALLAESTAPAAENAEPANDESPAPAAGRKRPLRAGKWLWYAAAGACVLVLAISTAFLLSYYLQYREAGNTYANIAETVMQPLAQAAHGEGDEKVPFAVDFDKLAAINPQITAWIACDGTKINYPVVQGTDNAYYLTRLFDLTYNPSGTLFVDYRAQADFAGQNTIIYGHNMLDGSMFSSLEGYGKQSYYDAHPRLQLYTKAGDYDIEVFAAYEVPADGNAWRMEFASGEDMAAWAAEAKAGSGFTSDVQVAPGDRIVTLSTCVNNNDEVRFVVMGKLVPAAQ